LIGGDANSPGVNPANRLVASQNGNSVGTSQTVNDNTWKNGVITVSSSIWSLFINGVFENSKSMTTNTSNTPYMIGYDNANLYFSGSVSNILVYNRALSQAEILQNYDSQKLRFKDKAKILRDKKIIRDNLAIYYDFSNPLTYPLSSTASYDLTGNANIGLLSGSASAGIPSFTPSYYGGMRFDATSSMIRLLTENNVSSSAYTIETVLSVASNSSVYTGGNTANQFIVFRQNRNAIFFEGIQQWYQAGAGAATGRWFSTCTNAATNAQISVSASLSAFNTPTVLTTTFDSSSIRIYVNGVLTGSTNTGFALSFNTANLFRIGRSAVPANSFDGPFNGTIYSFKLYNRALTESEVAYNFQEERINFGI
jgi:hypothetical protein